MTASPRTLVFLCAPHTGILDNWLPVLRQLRAERPDDRFVGVFPHAGQVSGVASDDPLAIVADDVLDEAVFASARGRWRHAPSLLEASSLPRLRSWGLRCADRIDGRVAKSSRRTATQIGSRVSRVLRRIADARASVAVVTLIDATRRRRYDVRQLADGDPYVCYCVSSEFKEGAVRDVLEVLRDAPRFSIYHGGINTVVPEARKARTTLDDLNLTVFLGSEVERRPLGERFGISDEVIQVVGMPRHSPSWMATIREVSARHHTVPFGRFALLVSRPIDRSGLPRERKLAALEDLRTLIIEGMGLPLLVKPHPKESAEGVVEEVLGRDHYGIDWAFTRAHAFQLAPHCEVAVSFGSGIDVDMVVSGVPAIDRRDRRGLSNYDTPEAVRDADGRILDSFATIGAVFVAEQTEDLVGHLDAVKDDRDAVASHLLDAYRSAFPEHGDVALDVASSIANRLRSG